MSDAVYLDFVTKALIPRPRSKPRQWMTEAMKADIWVKIAAIGSMLSGLVVVTWAGAWLLGIQVGNGVSAEKLQQLSNQQTYDSEQQRKANQALSDQMEKLSHRFDEVPRTADMTALGTLINSQLSSVQNHLTALDARADADERQQRQDAMETAKQLSNIGARIQNIEDASKASLGRVR